MINYTEKGYGQHAAVRKAGHSLREENGTWVTDDDVAVQTILDSYTLANCQDEIKGTIDTLAAKKRNSVVGSTSPAEMASWSLKIQEAHAYLANNTAATPMLTPEANARGVTVFALAQKVVANNNQLAGIEAAIAGVSGKHRDAVGATTTFQAALAYDYSTGWPV
jgi:hypothetical protein